MQVDQLLEAGADPKAVDKRKVSALQYACAQGRLEVIQRLYRRGVELDVEDPGKSVANGARLHFHNRSARCVVMAYIP